MPVSLPIPYPDDSRILFGPQDVNLRRIRETTGASLVFRDEILVIDGDDNAVKIASEALTDLLAIVQKKGSLREDEVVRALDRSVSAGPAEKGSVEIPTRTKKVVPKTRGQAEYLNAIRDHDLVFCTGPAGCGKTYLAVAMAIWAIRKELVRKIVLVRPAVEAGEKIGFLPGDMLAKVNPFLRPLLDAMNDMIEYEQVKRYMETDVVEIAPLAFMRGRTLNETFIILDEAQNTTVTQMKMFLTRMGEGSKIVVTGDATQSDLPPQAASGLVDAIHRLDGIEGVAIVELTGKDIVRHRLVREIVSAYEEGHRRARKKV